MLTAANRRNCLEGDEFFGVLGSTLLTFYYRPHRIGANAATRDSHQWEITAPNSYNQSKLVRRSSKALPPGIFRRRARPVILRSTFLR